MPASGQSQLEVVLNYRDNLSGKAPKTIKALTGIEKGAKGATKAVDQLNKSLGRNVRASGLDAYERRLGKLRGELRTSVKDAELVRTSFGKSFDTKGIDAAISKTREYQRATKPRALPSNSPARRRGYQPGEWMRDSDNPPDWRRELKGGRAPRKREEGGFLEGVERVDTAIETGKQIGVAWRERAESLEKYTDAYLELAQAKAKFVAINLTDDDNRKAFDSVDHTVKSIRGLTQAGTMETLTDLHTALGNLDHAVDALPLASRYRFGIETLFGSKFSKEEVDNQIQSGFKFLEMVGAVRATGETDEHGKRHFTHTDQGRMEEYFNRVAQITTATGGRITPAEMLAMAKTGGMSLQGLTAEGLAHLVGPMGELGGSRTGTALQAMYQAMVGGTMPQHMIGNWEKLGLVDRTKVEFNKSGIPKRLEPGAIPIGELLQKDPLAFADALRDAMQKHGVDTHDVDAVNRTITGLFGRNTNRELASLLINQRDRVIKEASLATGAKDIDGLYSQAIGSDMGKLKEFEAQWTNFKAEMGKPMMELATGITQGLRPVAEFFASHPNVTRYAAELLIVTKGLGALVETGSLLNRSGILDFFTRTRAAAGPAGEEIAKVEGKMGRLRGMASSPLVMTLKFMVAGIALEKVLSMWEESQERAELQRHKSSEAEAAYNDMTFGPGRARPSGERNHVLAEKAIDELKLGDHLEHMLEPERRRLFEGYFSFSKVYGGRWAAPLGRDQFFDPSTAAGAIRNSGSSVALDNAYVMKEVIAQIRAGAGMSLSDEGKSRLEQAFALAKPEQYKQAVEMLSAEQKKSADEFTKLNGLLPGVSSSLLPLPPAFGRAGSAADALGDRLNRVSLPTTFGALPFGFGTPKQPQAAPGGGLFTKPFTFQSKATGGIVRRGGLVEVHDEEAIVPADVTNRWRDSDLAGAPDYSAFAPAGGPHISVRIGDINVTGGDDPRAAGAAVAAEVERQVQEVLRRLAAVEGDLYDPRFIASMTGSGVSRRRERA